MSASFHSWIPISGIPYPACRQNTTGRRRAIAFSEPVRCSEAGDVEAHAIVGVFHRRPTEDVDPEVVGVIVNTKWAPLTVNVRPFPRYSSPTRLNCPTGYKHLLRKRENTCSGHPHGTGHRRSFLRRPSLFVAPRPACNTIPRILAYK